MNEVFERSDSSMQKERTRVSVNKRVQELRQTPVYKIGLTNVIDPIKKVIFETRN